MPDEEDKLCRRLRQIARQHPRWGWETAHAILRREGWTINRKRTQRLWRSEGLKRPAPCKRKRRRPDAGGELLRATRPNQVWALDFQFDETADHRRLKLLNIVDEHTREVLAMRVGRCCTADDVVGVIERLVSHRGAPEHLRMDNGPELVAFALREWCRLAGTATTYIEPESPWENPFVESFNGRVRDELLNVEEFATLLEAEVVVESWRTEHNTYRPHSFLCSVTPDEFSRKWTTNQPALP